MSIDQDVTKLLGLLPGVSTLSKLNETCPEYVLILMNQLLQTLPLNKIAIAILRDKNAIADMVKFKKLNPDKIKKDEMKKLDKKANFFDSRVSVSREELTSGIALCIDLLNRIRLSDDTDVSVSATNITRWHFM